MFRLFDDKEQKMPENEPICLMQKAGSWYNQNANQLDQEITKYLDAAKITEKKKPRIIIVPHPGLIFGGPTAAYAFKAVSEFSYRNVFVIATSHLSYFKEIIVSDFAEFETPFGQISGNRDLSSFLFYKSKSCLANPELIQQEHALEMQYPFLKKCLPQAQIVPIVVSAASAGIAETLAELLYEAITPDDLVVISTDLSHYPHYEDANILDHKTLEAILSGKPDIFSDYLAKTERNFPPNTSTAACGAVGVLAGLHLAEKLRISDRKLLHYENSGDRPVGDQDAVVGYGAVAFYASEDEAFADTVVLSAVEKKLLLDLARGALDSALNQKNPPIVKNIAKDSPLNKAFGVFVTLKINNNLRGCIGNFEPQKPLVELVQETALSSAFQDPRFPELSKREFEKISLDISVLSPRRKIKSFEEIIPGKHGVYVQKGFYGGTYLPQVAPEQGWDRTKMMNSLCGQKAGMDENAWQDGSAEMFVYTANVFGD